VIKSDVVCCFCRAGYRRIELSSIQGAPGEYRCAICDEVLESSDGSTMVAYRITFQPSLASARSPVDRADAGLVTPVGLRPPCVTSPAKLSHPD
jgi:hypothetical protein